MRGARRRRRALTLAAAAVLLPPCTAAAQMVTGKVVVEVFRSPVDSVDVVLVADSSGKHVDSTRTGGTGIFYLNAPGGGVYRLELRRNSGTPWIVPPFTLGADETLERQFAVPMEFWRGYSPGEVEEVVVVQQVRATYPAPLLRNGIEGDCIVRVAVDTTGKPDMSSFKIVRSTHEQFCASAREAVNKMTFRAAHIRAEKVRQVIQLPFIFNLPK